MYNFLKFSVLLICLFLVQLMPLIGQENVQLKNGHFDPNLTEEQNIFLNRQASVLLDYSSKLLNKYKPSVREQEGRVSALFLIDAVVHEPYAKERPAVQEFFQKQIAKSIDEIVNTTVDEGAKIWKLYNHSFIVKTKLVTLAFDLLMPKFQGNDNYCVSDSLMEKLIDECDVLFISHEHRDHWRPETLKKFLELGIPVYAPPTIFADNKEAFSKINHLERVAHKSQKVLVKDGKVELQVVTYPGHQWSDVINNVSLVTTPEGLSFMHAGDQWNYDDFEWIDEVHKHFKVDVLIPNTWTADLARMAQGINPTIIISGHENELGHGLQHREPYFKTYLRKKGPSVLPENDKGYSHPLVMMTWGEAFHYSK
ncbi:MBL fold metallo-hydrolase [Sunxiuqinia elliptica]|uniref:L-ascorbate metabolism protein UlaG, beta-lactamase superfamily n=1 Tax=Sunxiuqinia elliptica TaxID=655355 RepID=A0A1I2KQM2_9BACT|nr:MBL fold metallo-hydrolase [Sunxiuqinia elliptica]SFF67421.1 L-ascorbate metabolism protein UlaG, beta-lactamase superfamily [Sunxiuqinia elliptica]